MNVDAPIVFVDNDEDDQFLVNRVIRDLNVPYPLRFFWNGEQALTYLETTIEQPLLILCDISMPIMNGLELRQLINQSDFLRQKAIPFFYLTTSTNESHRQLALQQLVQGYYVKPDTYHELYEQLKQIVNQK